MDKQNTILKSAPVRQARLRVRVIRAPIVSSRELRQILTARAKALVL